MKTKYEYKKTWKKKNPKKFRKSKNKENRKYFSKYPERKRFAQKVHLLLKKGVIKKQPCMICGSIKQVEATTLSGNPYSPTWLCDRCNKEIHRVIRQKKLVLGVV